MTPRLRFPGFTDDWRTVKLGDIANRGQYGLNAAATEFDGVDKYIRITDIDEFTNQFSQDNLTSPSGNLSDKYLLQQDDILFARTGASVGKSYIYNEKDGKVYFAGFLMRFKVTSANAKFVFYNTLRHSYDKWVKTMSARSGQPGINAEEYESLRFNIPNKQEQEKIAEFLTAVDERIELQSNKVEKLEIYKRGLVQKIFSQQLRFRKSDNTKFSDWESVRLRDVLNCGSKTPVINTDEYNKLTVGLNKAGVRPAKIDRKMSDTRPFYVRSKNELIVGKQNYFSGSIAVIPDELDGAIASNAIMSFTPKRGNVKFIYEYISQNNYINKRNALANGTGQKELSENDFLNFDIGIPTEEEQQKIAAFLSQIDEKITLEAQKLEELKKFKKALLQRMFV